VAVWIQGEVSLLLSSGIIDPTMIWLRNEVVSL